MSSEDCSGADYDEVLRVLPESFRIAWKENPDVLVYLADLGSLGLQRLSQEPDRLAEEKASILEQTQDLAFHNYKTFIQAAECSHKIFQDFNIIESRLDSLVGKLPAFKDKCGEFGKEAQKINVRWRQASLTLSKYPQLLEFLEMPQLMDTYVKSGCYDEALELSTHVKRLERKHSDIPLINSVVKDIQNSTNEMLSNLLIKLRTNIQLPDCLKVVGYLKRINVFNESELRIKFLQARDSWFQKVINDIEKNDPYDHVIKVIESSRVLLFDITTQYRAIFSDDDPLLLVREESKENSAIFHSWITWKISWFLDILKKDVSADLGGRIDSVLAQCMYFGLSFSRVNIDFRPLLVPIFEEVTLKKFCAAIQHATFRFEKIMESFLFTVQGNASVLVTSLTENNLQPPVSLLDFHPLAHYCNDLLAALNDLKLCCSFSIAVDVLSAIHNSFKRVVDALVRIHTKHPWRMNDLEMENFNRFCNLLSSDLVPHINKCLSVVFPPDSISQVLGVTSIEFKKYDHLCTLNADALMEPLQSILPSKEDVGLTFTVDKKLIQQPSQENLSGEKTPEVTENVFSLIPESPSIADSDLTLCAQQNQDGTQLVEQNPRVPSKDELLAEAEENNLTDLSQSEGDKLLITNSEDLNSTALKAPNDKE